MIRIKCCGMTRVEDAVRAAELGADAIGLIFTARSRRRVAIDQARAIARALPPMVTTVALFMDEDAAFVDEVIASVQPALLQFHGAERDDWCAQFGRPYLKAIGMGGGAGALPRLHDFPGAAGLVLDGHGLGETGGSGKPFDWSLMPRDLAQPLILAGGLHPGNVAAAIRMARPWGVDVSSGIESSPGIKDLQRMRAFIEAARAA
ncbi:MAG TPA: phosphoribosylanthranilate isomerase [Frateuria sp.]|uniref:phosphoribosylanthranilate isomerase n=1 Tax=Frateuria sp. TaxID=2211372 RepID=UPI002D7E2F38|nr:phosphoribosylanthranilate isomerase [Frateuria sp.]HET6806790.1 phosphoribosylanthranilate isomerase [Frateuria sp.]